MRISLSICLLIAATCSAGWSQTTPAAKTGPAKKPPATPPAKPATTTAAQPTAVIETTAGKLTSTLFSDVAPIGVANFIGLAEGTMPIQHADGDDAAVEEERRLFYVGVTRAREHLWLSWALARKPGGRRNRRRSRLT